MRLLPHEPSSRREKANQDPAEQQRRKLLMPGGVGGVVLGTSFLPRGTADPPFVTSGENTELGSSSHLPRTEEWPIPGGERTSLSLLLPGDQTTAPQGAPGAQQSSHPPGTSLPRACPVSSQSCSRSSRHSCLQEAQLVLNLVSATCT